MSHKIRQQVTDRILKAMNDGLVPWQRPWLGHKNDGLPTKVLTFLPFRGINTLLLNLEGFTSKWWGTQRVWTAIGFEVKPHQEGTQIVFGHMDNLGYQTVFNAEQVEGGERFIITSATGKCSPDYDAADKVIAATGADIRHLHCNRALYYRLPKDYIELPLKVQFECGRYGVASYYVTVLHEICHWSEHRLGWLADPHLSVKQRYAIGEFRACLGASFLAAELGVPDNVKEKPPFFCQWMNLMKADNTLVFRVAEAASEAAKFILSFSEQQKHTA